MTDTAPISAAPATDAAPPEAAVRRRPALSPSRAGDFKQCPLLYRLRAIDRLPERPTLAQVRGTVVHAVLERLYGLPAEQRVPARARALVEPVWAELSAGAPEFAELFESTDDPALAEWLESAGALLDTYFTLEDPRRLEPAAREQLVEAELESGLLLRGYVDRLDEAPTGQLRVVDYKTGAAPRQVAEARALFQMKFYALVLLTTRGVVPSQLRLMYLADGESLTYRPDEPELRRFARTLDAIWAAITRAGRTGDFRPNPSRLCDWCSHQALCPAFGGTPPDYPGWPEPDPAVTGGRACSTVPGEPRMGARAAVPVSRLAPFYRPLGDDRFLATESTVGPWFSDAQHIGPPSALIVRTLERCVPRADMQLARITLEVLGVVPVGELTITARVERPGRTIELLAAEMSAAGRPVLRARAWRLATGHTEEAEGGAAPALAALPPAQPWHRPPGWLPGYLEAMEWRWLRGGFDVPGDGTVWVRPRVPVVEGEQPSPLQRLASVADSSNGVASRLDITRWLFLNTELSLHLHRAPAGEWIGVHAHTVIGPSGLGTVSATLFDRDGHAGRCAQQLTVRPRAR